jgi:hypothetical protein
MSISQHFQHRCSPACFLPTSHSSDNGEEACRPVASNKDASPRSSGQTSAAGNSQAFGVDLDESNPAREASTSELIVSSIVAARDHHPCVEQIHPGHALKDYAARCLHGVAGGGWGCPIPLLRLSWKLRMSPATLLCNENMLIRY